MIGKDWYVGMEVVCTDAKRRPYAHLGFQYVEERRVYTIRDIYVTDAGIAILVNGVVNREAKLKGIGIREPGFSASHFRPVQTRKTDISFAHEILRKAGQRVDA